MWAVVFLEYSIYVGIRCDEGTQTPKQVTVESHAFNKVR
jgi:hypothetical protein